MNPVGAPALAGAALWTTINDAPPTTAAMAATTISQSNVLRVMRVAFLEERCAFAY